MKCPLIIGAGGYGRFVAGLLFTGTGFVLVGFLDDAFPELEGVWELLVLGKVDDLANWSGVPDFAFVAIGNNELLRWVSVSLNAADFSIPIFLHPSAIVSPSVAIGKGTAIMAGANVGTEAKLGDGVIVNTAEIDHHYHAGDYAHLGVNAALVSGSVHGTLVWMRAGSSFGYGIELQKGRDLVLGEAVHR